MGRLVIAPNVVLSYINLSKTVTFRKGNKGILNWTRPLGKLVKQNEIWMLKIFVDWIEFYEHLWIWREYFSSVFFIFVFILKLINKKKKKKKVENETWPLFSFDFYHMAWHVLKQSCHSLGTWKEQTWNYHQNSKK